MHLKLQNFEGPIELLYNLIYERKLDICQVSLAKVTEQYISHIKHFEETDPKNLAEFLVIAARLILIKSKALLPSLEVTAEEEEEIRDLERRLALYKKLREMSKNLKKIYKNSSPSFSRDFMASAQVVFLPPQNITKNSLADCVKNIISKIHIPAVLPEKTMKLVISFEEIIKNLHNRIQNAIHKTFSQATKSVKSKMEVILHFLALLELVKQKHITAKQNSIFGEIEFEANN